MWFEAIYEFVTEPGAFLAVVGFIAFIPALYGLSRLLARFESPDDDGWGPPH